jgi:plastocyanin
MTTRRGALTLVVLCFVAIGCGGDDDAPPAPTSESAAAPSEPPATTVVATTEPVGSSATTEGPVPIGSVAGASVVVEISNFEFGPAEIDVEVGATVTWTNSDDQPHTATASGVFDTGSIGPGESASVTFDTAGTFAYICKFHPFMTATVVVA